MNVCENQIEEFAQGLAKTSAWLTEYNKTGRLVRRTTNPDQRRVIRKFMEYEIK